MNYSIAIDNIRAGRLDLVEDMWELQQKFLDSVQNLTVRQATQELPPILGRLLQSYGKLRHHDC